MASQGAANWHFEPWNNLPVSRQSLIKLTDPTLRNPYKTIPVKKIQTYPTKMFLEISSQANPEKNIQIKFNDQCYFLLIRNLTEKSKS